MSTLPRSRSLGRADSSAYSLQRDKNRPSSLCEASWVRITPSVGHDLRQEVIRRTPSQANNLCTTVPTSLVSRNLGGRHAPTRNSLRHSRMLVAKKDNNLTPVIRPKRRWKNSGRDLSRIGPLVVTAQILVGLMGTVLAVWFLLWTPFLHFREIPHYASLPVFFSGLFGAIFLNCSSKANKCLSHFLKINVGVLCLISIVTCMCVCVFSAFHLIQLTPMDCSQQPTIAIHSIAPQMSTEASPKTEIRRQERNAPETGDDENEIEGSGMASSVYQDDEDLLQSKKISKVDKIPQDPVPISSIMEDDPQAAAANFSNCFCERRRGSYRIVHAYPGLNCGEVKNILPILFVANCVVTTVGAILSGVILYVLWVSRRTYPRSVSANPSELRPFIYKSKFKNPPKNQNGNLANGSLYR